MNLVEAYIKYNDNLVIFISGMSGCGKTSISKKLSTLYNINLIEQFNYYKDNYDTKVTLPDDSEHINYNSDDAFNWDKLNRDIKKNKGIIVVGNALLDDKITTKPDYHIHLSMSKQECMEKRRIHLEKNKDKYPIEYKIINTPAEKLKMNKLIFPYYLDAKKRSKIDKYINIADMSDNEIYNSVFDILESEVINQHTIETKYWKYKNSIIDTPLKSDQTPEETVVDSSEESSVDSFESSKESTQDTENTEDTENRDLDDDYEDSQTIKDGPIEFEGVDTLTMETLDYPSDD